MRFKIFFTDTENVPGKSQKENNLIEKESIENSTKQKTSNEKEESKEVETIVEKKESKAISRQITSLGEKHLITKKGEKENTAFLFDVEDLNTLLQAVVCSSCRKISSSKPVLTIKKASVFYMDCKVSCRTCKKILLDLKPEKVEEKIGNEKPKIYDKKTIAAVYGAMIAGVGHLTLNRICTAIGLKMLCKSEFHRYKKMIYRMTKNVCDDHLLSNVTKIKDFYRDTLEIFPDNNNITNIVGISDGTWKQRGWSSNLGAAVMCEAHTGLIVDYASFSKICPQCTKHKNWLNDPANIIWNKDKFDKWHVTHQPYCTINFKDCSGQMEIDGITSMFARSVDKFKLRYTTLIGDGDCKSYKAVTKLKPYGDEHLIEKKECINHVTKRMGGAIRDIRSKAVTMDETVILQNEQQANVAQNDQKNKVVIKGPSKKDVSNPRLNVKGPTGTKKHH